MRVRQLAVYVPISAVFMDVKADFETLLSLLQGLSRTDTLVWCARLNLALSDCAEEPIKRQMFCMERFLSPEEMKRVFAFATNEESDDKRVILFSRGQILELMRWASLYCKELSGDGETFNDPEARRRFFQAALVCSEILNTAIWGTDSTDDTALALLQGNALNLCRKAAEATATTNLNVCLGRGWTLFCDYLPKHYPSFDEEFQTSTGLSVKQYFACLSMVLADSRRPFQNGGFSYDTVLRRTPYNDAFMGYMSLESQTPDELRNELARSFPEDLASLAQAPPYNKRPLLDRPVLRTERGLAIILDPVCFGESALAGPLFHVIKGNPAKARDLFSAFGHAFEDYVNSILGRMFPTSAVLAKRLFTNETIIEYGGNRLEVDACINDLADVVLIESKAVWLQEDKVLAKDHTVYADHMRSKYVEHKKGVAQLARMISALSDPRQSGANERFGRATLIYPVMIVHDRFVPTPYIGRFLQPQFESCLVPDKVLTSRRMKKGMLTITPLVVIDVETLEGLESMIKHYGLLDIMADYLQEYSDGSTSLRNFVASSPKYEQHFNPGASVKTKALEVLNVTAHEVFPDADFSDL